MRDPELSFKFAWALIRMGLAVRSRMFADAAEKQWIAAGYDIGIGSVLTIRALEDFYLHLNTRAVERCQQALAFLPEDRTEDRARLFAVLGMSIRRQVTLPRPRRQCCAAACLPAKWAVFPYSSSI